MDTNLVLWNWKQVLCQLCLNHWSICLMVHCDENQTTYLICSTWIFLFNSSILGLRDRRMNNIFIVFKMWQLTATVLTWPFKLTFKSLILSPLYGLSSSFYYTLSLSLSLSLSISLYILFFNLSLFYLSFSLSLSLSLFIISFFLFIFSISPSFFIIPFLSQFSSIIPTFSRFGFTIPFFYNLLSCSLALAYWFMRLDYLKNFESQKTLMKFDSNPVFYWLWDFTTIGSIEALTLLLNLTYFTFIFSFLFGIFDLLQYSQFRV